MNEGLVLVSSIVAAAAVVIALCRERRLKWRRGEKYIQERRFQKKICQKKELRNFVPKEGIKKGGVTRGGGGAVIDISCMQGDSNSHLKVRGSRRGERRGSGSLRSMPRGRHGTVICEFRIHRLNHTYQGD